MEPFRIDADIDSFLHDTSDQDLLSFADLIEDLASDDQTELFIYTCLLISMRTHSAEHLERAIQRAVEWVVATEADHPDRTRRCLILDMLFGRQHGPASGDFEPAPYEARQGIGRDAGFACSHIQCMLHHAQERMEEFERTRDAEKIDQAITLMERAERLVQEVQSGDTRRIAVLNVLMKSLDERFGLTSSMADLDRIVEVANMAVDATPLDHPIRVEFVAMLGNRLGTRYERAGSVTDLERAIEVLERGLDVTPKDNNTRVALVYVLRHCLAKQFERTSSTTDHDRLIELSEMAVDGIPMDHPKRVNYFVALANLLDNRHQRTGSAADLDRIIEVANIAVNATLLDDPNRDTYVALLGMRLCDRHEQTGSAADLERAIEVLNQAVDVTPQDNNGYARAAAVAILHRCLVKQSALASSLTDRDRLIEVTGMVVNATPRDASSQGIYLKDLGDQLHRRYQATSSLSDLNRAIESTDLAINAMPQGSPEQARALGKLGLLHLERFELVGSMADLDRAIHVTKMAIDGGPQEAAFLNNLGTCFSMRFGRSGLVADLDRAIDAVGKAIIVASQDNYIRATALCNLGGYLGVRYERTGLISDLNRAIDLVTNARDTARPGDPNRHKYLSNLGTFLNWRYTRIGSMDDLDRAVEASQMAVDELPQGHIDRPRAVGNVASLLCTRYHHVSSTADLARAIELTETAMSTGSLHDDDRGFLQHILGGSLGLRFNLTSDIADLDRAIDLTNMSLDAIPQDHRNRVKYLSSLANQVDKRHKETRSAADLERLLDVLERGWNCRGTAPSIRVTLGIRAVGILCSRMDWHRASLLLEEIVNLIPLLTTRWSAHTDRRHQLAKVAYVGGVAAAVALFAGKEAHHALEQLELSRKVIAGQLMEMPGDISALQQSHPDLAREFISIRKKLDTPTNDIMPLGPGSNISSWESEARRHLNAGDKYDQLLGNIRSQRGFHNFLLPPTANQLKATAAHGPIIVINLTPLRSDAFLIERDQIRALPLPLLKHDEVESRSGHLKSCRNSSSAMLEMLIWLWRAVASPCLEALGFTGPPSDNEDWPRVWWIPTGPLRRFPLHAAGYHARGSSLTVMDRVMSSYALSVTALQSGRQQHVRDPVRHEHSSGRAVFVAMEDTPGLLSANRRLKFAADEVKMLRQLSESLHLEPIAPTRRRDDVLQSLGSCSVFHFAGHGQSDPTDPSQSRLLLDDWKTHPMTAGDVRDRRLQLQETPPFLAYLSACSTGANEVEDMVDEGVHLISAFQLANFRHVIGALWEVLDSHCVDVAREFYQTIADEGMTDRVVCRGLHRAVRALRDRGMGTRGQNHREVGVEDDVEIDIQELVQIREGRDPMKVVHKAQDMSWVPYVHFGV